MADADLRNRSCTFCGKVFDSSTGMKQHSSRYCKLNPDSTFCKSQDPCVESPPLPPVDSQLEATDVSGERVALPAPASPSPDASFHSCDDGDAIPTRPFWISPCDNLPSPPDDIQPFLQLLAICGQLEDDEKAARIATQQDESRIRLKLRTDICFISPPSRIIHSLLDDSILLEQHECRARDALLLHEELELGKLVPPSEATFCDVSAVLPKSLIGASSVILSAEFSARLSLQSEESFSRSRLSAVPLLVLREFHVRRLLVTEWQNSTLSFAQWLHQNGIIRCRALPPDSFYTPSASIRGVCIAQPRPLDCSRFPGFRSAPTHGISHYIKNKDSLSYADEFLSHERFCPPLESISLHIRLSLPRFFVSKAVTPHQCATFINFLHHFTFIRANLQHDNPEAWAGFCHLQVSKLMSLGLSQGHIRVHPLYMHLELLSAARQERKQVESFPVWNLALLTFDFCSFEPQQPSITCNSTKPPSPHGKSHSSTTSTGTQTLHSTPCILFDTDPADEDDDVSIEFCGGGAPHRCPSCHQSAAGCICVEIPSGKRLQKASTPVCQPVADVANVSPISSQPTINHIPPSVVVQARVANDGGNSVNELSDEHGVSLDVRKILNSDRSWYSDEVIDRLTERIASAASSPSRRVESLSSLVYVNVSFRGSSRLKEGTLSKLREANVILWPICIRANGAPLKNLRDSPNHWVSVVILPRSSTILIFNSLRSCCVSTDQLAPIHTFVFSTFSAKAKFRVKFINRPTQSNCNDCGPFTIAFLESAAFYRRRLPFRQSSMPSVRDWVRRQFNSSNFLHPPWVPSKTNVKSRSGFSSGHVPCRVTPTEQGKDQYSLVRQFLQHKPQWPQLLQPAYLSELQRAWQTITTWAAASSGRSETPVVDAVILSHLERGKTAQPGTIKKYLLSARALFLRADQVFGSRPFDLLDASLFKDLIRSLTKMERADAPPSRPFCTPEQIRVALTQAPSDAIKALLLITWSHSSRPSNTLHLRPSNISISGNLVTILWSEAKTVASRGPFTTFAKLPPQWIAFLQNFLREPREQIFAPNHRSLLNQLRTILQKVDPELDLRALRRGSLIALAKTGISEADLLNFSGHRCVENLRRYLQWGRFHLHHQRQATELSDVLFQ